MCFANKAASISFFFYLLVFTDLRIEVAGFANEIADLLLVDFQIGHAQHEFSARVLKKHNLMHVGVYAVALYLFDVGKELIDGAWNDAGLLGGACHCV